MPDVYIMSAYEIKNLPAVGSALASGLVAGFLQKPLGRHVILSVLKKYQEGSRVMLVEDYEPSGKAIGRTIASSGYKPVICSSGMEALEEYKDDIPLVFSDFDMPGMNGVELAEELKKKSGNKV